MPEPITRQYAIYDHPRDFPGHFVVREWRIIGDIVTPAADCRLAETLEDARRFVPPGFYRLDRFPGDDPAIVEVWI